MKKTFFAFAIFFAIKSQAATDWDQCYQLYMPGAMYPAICLDGTGEEGIGGAGVRLVVFATNTDIISACGLSSALVGSANSLEFITGSSKLLILSEVKNVNFRLEGSATFGRTRLKFLQINPETSKRLLSKFYAEPRCKNVAPGTIVKLK